MKPREMLEQTTTAEGQMLALYRHGDDFFITIGGDDLMSSRTHGSEEALAHRGIAALGGLSARPTVLVGGLGMGFTVRAALDRLPGQARVVVAEVFPKVVEWNRRWLAELAGAPLRDPRVTVRTTDVHACLEPQRFDLILLDVDNGPDALTLSTNRRLYGDSGLATIHDALRTGGVLAVWSAAPDDAFLDRMRRAGFEARSARVRARQNKGSWHTIFTGGRP